MNKKLKYFLIAILALGAIVGFRNPIILAYVMSGDNYRIQQDAIDVGGSLGSSANYKLEDSVGEIGTGYSASANYNLHAGYQQGEGLYYITLTAPDGASLSPDISGLTGGQANAAASVGVSTDNPHGYTLQIRASTSPALQCTTTADNFADYAPAGSDPDFDWSVFATSSAFGFSPKGDDVVSRYLDDGSQCGQGALQTGGKCWDPVFSTNTTISQSASRNAPDFTTTTINFRAELGNSLLKPSCVYTATIINTAIAN